MCRLRCAEIIRERIVKSIWRFSLLAAGTVLVQEQLLYRTHTKGRRGRRCPRESEDEGEYSASAARESFSVQVETLQDTQRS